MRAILAILLLGTAQAQSFADSSVGFPPGIVPPIAWTPDGDFRVPSPAWPMGVPFNISGPMIPEDAGTVAHVYWNGTALVDTKGNAWTQNGVVPQVTVSPLYPTGFSGTARAGAGPFSDANYYSLGTGSDVLDFAGDFTVCVIWKPVSLATAVQIGDGIANTSGWIVDTDATGFWKFHTYSGVDNVLSSLAAPIVGGINIGCAGRSGGNGALKLNGAAIVTGAMPITQDTTNNARIGRYAGAGAFEPGTILEVWASTTTPSDALFTAIQTRFFQQISTTNAPLTVTRSTPITYTVPAASGQTLWTSPANTLPITPNGAEIYAVFTNSALQSETMASGNTITAPWVKVGSPTTASGIAGAPNGTATMVSVTSAANTEGVTQAVAMTNSVVGTSSIWASKAASGTVTGTYVCTAGTASSCTCTTSDGSACSTAVATTTCTAKFTAVATSPVRLSHSTTCATGLTNPTIGWYPGELGVSTGTANFWGAQVTPTAYPMPYSGATVAASVPISATVASVPLPALHLTNRWCIGVTATPGGGRAWSNASAFPMLVQAGTAGSANNLQWYANAGSITFRVVDSGNVVKDSVWIYGGSLSAGSTHRLVAVNNAGTLSFYSDGVSVGTASGVGTGLWNSSPATITLGNRPSGGLEFDGALSNLKIKVNPASWQDCQ